MIPNAKYVLNSMIHNNHPTHVCAVDIDDLIFGNKYILRFENNVDCGHAECGQSQIALIIDVVCFAVPQEFDKINQHITQFNEHCHVILPGVRLCI